MTIRVVMATVGAGLSISNAQPVVRLVGMVDHADLAGGICEAALNAGQDRTVSAVLLDLRVVA